MAYCTEDIKKENEGMDDKTRKEMLEYINE